MNSDNLNLTNIQIQEIYENIGGKFLLPIEEMALRCQNIRQMIFDWDGVFNSGAKSENYPSTFSEPDMMGINLLRYAIFRLQKSNGLSDSVAMPKLAIITGQKNENAELVSKREKYSAMYFKSLDKKVALDHFCNHTGFSSEQTVIFFDDVLDIGAARNCGLKMMMSRKANPIFELFCIQNKSADYLTAHSGGNGGLREATELLMSLSSDSFQIFQSRILFDSDYKNYITLRSLISPAFYECKLKEIDEVKLD